MNINNMNIHKNCLFCSGRKRSVAIEEGLPALQQHPNKKSKTGSGAAPHLCRHYPTKISHWASFKKEACYFKYDAGSDYTLVPGTDKLTVEGISSEPMVESAMSRNVYKIYEKICPPEWKCHLTPNSQYPNKLVGLPDGLIWREEGKEASVLVSGEVKTPWTLRKGGPKTGTDFQSGELIAANWNFSKTPKKTKSNAIAQTTTATTASSPTTPAFAAATTTTTTTIAANTTSPPSAAPTTSPPTAATTKPPPTTPTTTTAPESKNVWGAQLGTGMRQSLAQIIGYMIDNRTRFGFLTAYDRTWFLKFVTCDHFEISDAILDADSTTPTSPSLMRSFIFVTSLALEKGPIPQIEMETHATQRRRSGGKNGVDGLSDKKEMNGTNNTRSSSGPSGGCRSSQEFKAGGEATESAGLYNELFDSLCVPLLSDTDLEWGRVLGWGRQGTVVEVGWRGLLFALKMFDLSKGRVLAMEKEVQTYVKAESLQGSVIPKLVLKFVSPSGQVYGIGLEKGSPLPEDDDSWTPQQRAGSTAALNALEQFGIHHNDVRNQNFLLLNNSVNVIDFEDVTFSPISSC